MPLAGTFEGRFLELPREVLIATLQDHQRYFRSASSNGTLLPRFIAVSNLESLHPDQVRAGNERVVRATPHGRRIFLRHRPQATPARPDVQDSAQVTYQTRLGSLQDKVTRTRTLAARVAERIGADPRSTERAADLCKCDLLTAMVGEFPELQGTMGSYYARHDGEQADVSIAIASTICPRYAGDRLPAAAAPEMALAIADKIDTITGIFAIDQKPTGTRDPFGVRRAALGLVRIIIERQLELDLRELIATATQLMAAHSPGVRRGRWRGVRAGLRLHHGAPALLLSRPVFRIGNQHRDVRFGVEQSSTVAARLRCPIESGGRRSEARCRDQPRKCQQAHRQHIAQDRDPDLPGREGGTVTVSLPSSACTASSRRLRPQVEPLLEQRNYAEALQRLAQLREPVDAFFDSVMVMDEDTQLRTNRLHAACSVAQSVPAHRRSVTPAWLTCTLPRLTALHGLPVPVHSVCFQPASCWRPSFHHPCVTQSRARGRAASCGSSNTSADWTTWSKGVRNIPVDNHISMWKLLLVLGNHRADAGVSASVLGAEA